MKKNIVRGLLFLIFVTVIGFSIYFGYKYFKQIELENKENEKIEKIKSSYSEIVITTNEKAIYKLENEHYKQVGLVQKDVILELDMVNIDDSQDIYFPIKNSNYYVEYSNLKKKDSLETDTSLDSYLVKKQIITVPTVLYKDDSVAFNLDEEYTFDVLAIENGKYYVKFLNQIYTIKDNFKLVDKNMDVISLEKISVINFSDDISDSKLEEIISYLKENGYSSISIDDFKLWVNGNVYLNDKKVLLITYGEITEQRKEIIDRYSMVVDTKLETISFTSGDQQLKVGDSTYYKYEVNSNTSLDRVKDMLNGVKLVVKQNQQVAVLNYHFFYDSNSEVCGESICISTENFRKQLSYLRDNGYKTLTMQEFNDWMDGKIEIPLKSVLITIDDGAAGTFNHLPQILNEYQMHATLFLISGWWPVSRYKSSPYLEIQSHTHDLHHSNYCDSNGCGYKTLKLSKEEIKNDLSLSISTIGSNLAFCYPFYQTNSNLVQAVKESGFKLGFVGGNRKASRTSSKYYVPRYIIYNNTSLESFIKIVKP